MPCPMKGAESDIDNEPPPPSHSITQVVNSSVYKPVKYHFQERKIASSCVSSFYLPQLNQDLCISIYPIWQVL